MTCLCCSGQMKLKGAYSQCEWCGYARSSIPADTSLYGEENAAIGKQKQLSSVGTVLDNIRRDFVKRHVKAGRLLDYGCNYGHFITLFGNNGITAEGYDINPLNGFVIVPRGTFDAVTMWDVLEHIEGDPLALVKELLAKDSWLFISVPCVDGMPEDITASHHWKPGEHVHFFTARGLCAYLDKNGFSIEERNFDEGTVRTAGHHKNILSVAAVKR